MTERCSNQNCFVHDGESCAVGNRDYTTCSAWVESGESTEEGKNSVVHTSDASRVPWSGSALGLADLTNLVPRGRSILVAVLGAHDAGKTTLLLGNYLQLLKGGMLANANFSGSRTLGAWESLASWVRFDDAARSPSFPPHTPRGTDRVPGLLHLALRNSNNELRDVLLADAPGEWFTRWSIQEDASEAEGARWLVHHADAFLILADCERLCGEGRGSARNSIRQLIERLGSHVSKRPTTLVWAKNDLEPPEGIQNAIRRTLQIQIPHAIEVGASIEDPISLVKALDTIVLPAWQPPLASPIISPVLKQQPFTAFRGFDART